jgi:Ca2+-binding RTX toxin-like protein
MPEFRPVAELSALNGRNGFQISGEAAEQRVGTSVDSAGDVNGDGFADVVVGSGAFDEDGYPANSNTYVVFGRAAGFPSNLQLSSLNGRNGFELNGRPGLAASVAPAGDVNGDGFGDVIAGYIFPRPYGSNLADYVVFGKAGGFPARLDVSSLNGANGFKIGFDFGIDAPPQQSVASAGDINGDGFADVIGIADSFNYDNFDRGVFVVFGKARGFPAELPVSSLDGGNGFRIHEDDPASVASAGDINGDGFDDFVIGVPLAGAPFPYTGGAYVVFGKAGRFAADFPLSRLDGGNGFQIVGEGGGGGESVAPAGDVNGDGFSDVIVGAPYASPRGEFSGASYVVFGKAGGFASKLNLSSLNGANGFQINGVAKGDQSGSAVASAGDINGDGFADVIIDTSIFGGGASYVVFGKASGFAANLELSGLDGSNGFRIEGAGPRFGESAASAGDANGDGFADVIIGDPLADPNGIKSGASHVVFGHRALDAVNRVGTPLDDTINGGRGNDTIQGLGGDDRLIAWEGNDLVAGNGGRDRLNGRAGNDRLIGGFGPDVLIGGFGRDVFDFNLVTDSGATADTRDVIRDFTHLADRIDLSDLGTLAFIGIAAFTGPGQVRVVQQGANTIVEINLSGDETPEMTIALIDVAAATLTEADFVL